MMINRILTRLKKFAKPFKIAQPILHMAIGWRAYLHHDNQAAFAMLQKALISAQDLSMTYERDYVIALSQRLLGIIPPA